MLLHPWDASADEASHPVHPGRAAILRTQLAVTEPGSGAADPSEHARTLNGIRGLRLAVQEVRAKFEYGGNADDAHRSDVAARRGERRGPGDAASLRHLQRRTPLTQAPPPQP